MGFAVLSPSCEATATGCGEAFGVKKLAAYIAFLTVACGSSLPVWAANDNALRAIYCIPVIDNQIRSLSSPPPPLPGVTPEFIEKTQTELRKGIALLMANRERLRMYALSHIALDGSDVLAIAVAKRRGEIDVAVCERKMSSNEFLTCGINCDNKCKSDTTCLSSCARGCAGPTCMRSMSSCLKPDWLPY